MHWGLAPSRAMARILTVFVVYLGHAGLLAGVKRTFSQMKISFCERNVEV